MLFLEDKMKEDDTSKQVDLAVALGYIAIKDLTTTEKKIAVLTNLGFSNKDMVKICGTTGKVVKTLKSKIKRGS
jgi:DNA-binding CsgD family transcriptional regulator